MLPWERGGGSLMCLFSTQMKLTIFQNFDSTIWERHTTWIQDTVAFSPWFHLVLPFTICQGETSWLANEPSSTNTFAEGFSFKRGFLEGFLVLQRGRLETASWKDRKGLKSIRLRWNYTPNDVSENRRKQNNSPTYTPRNLTWPWKNIIYIFKWLFFCEVYSGTTNGWKRPQVAVILRPQLQRWWSQQSWGCQAAEKNPMIP